MEGRGESGKIRGLDLEKILNERFEILVFASSVRRIENMELLF